MKKGLKKDIFSMKISKINIKKFNNISPKRFLTLKTILVAFILTLVFFLPIISATFSLGNPQYSMEKIYGPLQEISGWLNISFSDEPLSSSFVSTIGSNTESISLSEILESNSGYSYSCNPVNCENDYSATNQQTQKTFQLVAGGQQLINNGDFTTNIDGWTNDIEPGGTISWSSANGGTMALNGQFGRVSADQQIVTTAGVVYTLSIRTYGVFDGSDSIEVQVGTSQGGTNLLSRSISSSGVYTYTFTAQSTATHVRIHTGWGGLSVDDVSVGKAGSSSGSMAALKLVGNISSISSVSFDVQSSAPASCTSQLKIDLFDNGTIDFQNSKTESGNALCGSKDYGCFNSASATEIYTLTTQYCQKINIPVSPSVRVGAWIKNNSGSKSVKAELHDLDGVLKGSCSLPAITSEDEYYCDINYLVSEAKDYYVCIYPTTGTGDLRIKGNTQPQNSCGFQGNNFETPIVAAAYQISAQGKQFASFGTESLSNSLSNGGTFSQAVDNYLTSRYGKKNGKIDCSAGCIVPITLKSGVAQSVTLGNLKVNYQKDVGNVEENNFYDVTSTSAKITSLLGKLYIDGAGFSLPENVANYTFLLKLNAANIFSDTVQVKDLPMIATVSPLKTASAFPTDFVASIDSGYNVTGFSWNFGDGTTTVSLGKEGKTVTHTYNQVGEYTLAVSVTDNRSLSSTKEFTINVSSPEDLIESTLAELDESIKNIRLNIADFDDFSSNAIESSLSLSLIETSVTSLRLRYQNANTEEQFNSIVPDILALGSLPESISKTKQGGGLPLVTSAEDVNLDALVNAVGGSITGNENDYKNAVGFWQIENLDTKVDFNEFSGRYDGKMLPIIKTFKISVTEKTDTPYDYYLILPELESFYSDSQFEKKDGYVYINMKDQPGKTVSFSTTQDVDFTDLPAFISPSISKLSVERTLPEEPVTSKWLIFILVIVALLVIGSVVYIILHQWYKRRYEKHLFPSRNDLYNITTYIHNAQKKGMNNGDIESNLKKAGWSAERIRYAMKKYAGKKTGMPF